MSSKIVLGRSRELLYKISKLIAENDSIGKRHSYCRFYSKRIFDEEIKELEESKGTPDEEIVATRSYISLAIVMYDAAKEYLSGGHTSPVEIVRRLL